MLKTKDTLIQLQKEATGADTSPPILIEAGHFYADKGPGPEAIQGISVAISLLGLLDEQRGVLKLLFVDDLIPLSPQDLHSAVNSGITRVIDHGFKPDHTIYESELVAPAQASLDQLSLAGKTKDHKGRTMLKKGWVPLTGKGGNSRLPSCQMLDAVLYQWKLSRAGGVITVLDKSYYEQQQQTRKVLEAIGIINPNILIVLFDKNQVTADYWG